MTVRDFFRLDDDHPFTGWHMAAVVLLFFGVIVAVNVVMAVLATGTFPGLVVQNSYVASQGYNNLLAEARAQSRSGWRMELDAPAGLITVSLVDRDGVPARNLTVTVLAGRPSSTREDRLMALVADADGYRAAEALPAGQWDVDIEARLDGALAYRERRRVYVSAE